MRLGDIREELDSYQEDQRVAILGGLTQALCAFSIGSLHDFQAKWDRSRPFDEFVEAQNDVFRQCIDLECSEFGATVRAQLGLDPLTLDSDIKVQ